jgi:hypothetical protein
MDPLKNEKDSGPALTVSSEVRGARGRNKKDGKERTFPFYRQITGCFLGFGPVHSDFFVSLIVEGGIIL